MHSNTLKLFNQKIRFIQGKLRYQCYLAYNKTADNGKSEVV